MYIVYFRQGKWSVAWRYSSGETHFVASYENAQEAKKARDRMNDATHGAQSAQTKS